MWATHEFIMQLDRERLCIVCSNIGCCCVNKYPLHDIVCKSTEHGRVCTGAFRARLVPSDSRLCSRNLSSPLCPPRTRLRNALRLLPLAGGSVASTYAPTPRAAAFAAARLALAA